MEQLLKKFRELHHLIQNDERLAENDAQYLANDLPFENIATILSEVTDANIYILGTEGNLLGKHELTSMNNQRFDEYVNSRIFPESYVTYLNRILETQSNVPLSNESTIFPVENKEFKSGVTTIIPIFVSKQRLGNLLLGRMSRKFEVEDLILAEYSATIVGIELLHYVNLQKQAKKMITEKINLAISSLSFSEKRAVNCIFKNATSTQMRITASKIAEEYGITRSVIVNTLRKLESAGLLESQSLGMKGTYIKVNNTFILNELVRRSV